ncbi:PEGA domain-containing protein [Candidatus Saccharibacteria bacterium]|nr:PEGA domain-containing protein [Candidatus Saccharibacteria bacterium]
MYNQDPAIRRRRDRLRFFGYGAMTIATILLAVLSIYFVLGYRVNKSLQVEQGGLMKFDSRPRGATVTLNGVQARQTRYQVNAETGEHTIRYEREGYHPWQKTVSLHAGEVLWLEYARLIPTLVTTQPVADLAAVHQASTAPDREWMLLHATPETPVFSLVDARNEGKPVITELALPAAAFTVPAEGKPSLFDIQMWSRDSDFVLIRHSFNDADVEYIRLPVGDPARAENVSRLFGLPLASLRFAEGSNAVFFAQGTDASLLRLDRGDPAKPVTIAKSVVAFDELNEGSVAYAVRPDPAVAERQLFIWQRNGEKRTRIKTINEDVPMQLQFNQYYSHTYLTEVYGSHLEVTEDPLLAPRKTIISQSLSFTPAALQASPGNRFIMSQTGESIAVFDIELSQLYTFTSPAEARLPLQWADDHHIAMTGNGSLRLVEFDGTNSQHITAFAGIGDVLVGTEGRSLLSIGKQDNGSLRLQSSTLLTPADQ